ncbi:MAG TPA: arylsulfatase, partial [Prosthecobacter sp.]
IDRIAAEGMRFTQHYTGNAVCAPSRCVLMTGLHPGHAFVRNNLQPKDTQGLGKMGRPAREGQHPIPTEIVTLAEVFKSMGYITGGFGKWGLGGPDSTGAPLQQAFDRWFGYNCQGVAHNFYPTYLWDNDKVIDLKNPPFPSADKLKPEEDPTKRESYQRFQGTEYSADLISEQALKFARDNKDKPFFLYWPTTVPHLALQVPDDSSAEYVGKFDDAPYPGGNGYLPHFTPKAAYAGMITRMDRDIGRMMALITELGLDEETLFVFVSDNGPLNGTHAGLGGTDATFFNSAEGRRDGKGTLYEGGVRSPCVVRWKGRIKAGSTTGRVTGFEDWMTTLAELAGAKDKAPATTDGISFAPTLLGEKQPEREFLYREFPGYGGQQMLRMGDWKLVRTNLVPKAAKGKKAKAAAGPTEELFNIANDPAETKDVAKEHPDLIAKMKAVMATQHTNSADFPMAALDGQ